MSNLSYDGIKVKRPLGLLVRIDIKNNLRFHDYSYFSYGNLGYKLPSEIAAKQYVVGYFKL